MAQQLLFGPEFDRTAHGDGALDLALQAVAGESEAEHKGERRHRRELLRCEKQGDLAGMASSYIQLGDLFLAQGDSERAGEMYRRSLKLARDAGTASLRLAKDELL
jgi:tetratricopeptide (TPR) repeat protein